MAETTRRVLQKNADHPSSTYCFSINMPPASCVRRLGPCDAVRVWPSTLPALLAVRVSTYLKKYEANWIISRSKGEIYHNYLKPLPRYPIYINTYIYIYMYTCIYESHGHTIKVQSWCIYSIYLHFNGSRDVGECCTSWTGTFYMSSYCRIILLFHVIYNLKNHLSESPDSSIVLSRYVLAIPSFLGHFLHPFPSWI